MAAYLPFISNYKVLINALFCMIIFAAAQGEERAEAEEPRVCCCSTGPTAAAARGLVNATGRSERSLALAARGLGAQTGC